jgi:hypothetical protein
MSDQASLLCPFCKEEVKADAVRCKHCQAAIPPRTPPHEGVCPFCKEGIHPEAIRCRHCKSDLAVLAGHKKLLPRAAARNTSAELPCEPATTRAAPEHCAGCPVDHYGYDLDGHLVLWVLESCDEKYCIYAPGGIV